MGIDFTEHERNTTPVLVPNRFIDDLDGRRVASFFAYCDHAHELETGKCIKNRFGPRCNVDPDPFFRIEGETPHKKQQEFVACIVSLVNVYLSNWGKASGKTKARIFLAKAIIEGDN